MITEASQHRGTPDGPWLQFWNDANTVSLNTTRIVFGQLELAALTGHFLTQRLRAYESYDGGVESLAGRLGKITQQYADDYSKCVREIYSSLGKAGAMPTGLPTTDAPTRSEPDRSPTSPPRRSTRVAASAGSAKTKRVRSAPKGRAARERPKRKRNS
jgi:hypothetical protein